MTDDLVRLETEGWDAIAGIEQAPPWSWYRISDTRTLELSAGAVVVAYTATAQRDGEPEYHAHMSSTYVRRGASWKLAIHQQTPA